MPPLRKRMIEEMQIRNFAPGTQTMYLLHVAQFARYFGRPPEVLGREEIRSYQLYLTREKKLAASTITVAVSALRFLYKVTLRREWKLEEIIPAPKTPKKLPIILSPEEVLEFLGCVPEGKHHTIIRIEQGKGRKDRYVMLSPKLLENPSSVVAHGAPQIWLFPGKRLGHIGKQAVEVACKEARHLYSIRKPISPHSLRHAFAVHLLEQGVDVRTIQLRLGHRSLDLETTARYLRVATTKVCSTTSPLDLLPHPPSLETKLTPSQQP